MTKLYRKNELWFALVWIIVYVVGTSAADGLSEKLGCAKSITLAFHAVLTVLIVLAVKKLGIAEKCGLCGFGKSGGSAKVFLCFIPLLAIMSVNLWHGVRLNFTVPETLLYAASMLCVGFIEEVVFRGFLFNAIAKNGSVKTAIVISSLTFGIGHIVNLINGADPFETVMQICYACALGFLFTVILYKGKTLAPCIAAHSVINATGAFAVQPSKEAVAVISAVLCIVSVLYAAWIWRCRRS